MIRSPLGARKLFLTMICIELLLVVAYGTDAWVQGSAGQLSGLIDLDAEANMPTWFSSFQLALIALAFWSLAARSRITHRPSRRFLRLCGGFFMLLSLDETAMLHERTTAAVGARYIDWIPTYLVSHIGGTIACVLVCVACLAAAYPHLRGIWLMSRRASLLAIAGCATFVTGAAVLESIGYKMLNGGASPSLYRLEVAAEEFFEMLGASLILYSVLLLCCSAKNRHPLQRRTLAVAVLKTPNGEVRLT